MGIKNITDALPKRLRPYAKAVVTFLAALAGAALLVLNPSQVPQWLQIAAVLLGVTGGAYGARNDDAPEIGDEQE